MSVYIAENIIITPDKIISIGYDKNVYPHSSQRHDIPNTQEELRAIVIDLIDGMIDTQHPYWIQIRDMLKKYFTFDDIHDKGKMDEGVKLMKMLLNQRIIVNFDRMKPNNPDLKFQLL